MREVGTSHPRRVLLALGAKAEGRGFLLGQFRITLVEVSLNRCVLLLCALQQTRRELRRECQLLFLLVDLLLEMLLRDLWIRKLHHVRRRGTRTHWHRNRRSSPRRRHARGGTGAGLRSFADDPTLMYLSIS